MANQLVTPVGDLYWVRISGDGYDASIINGQSTGESKMQKSACIRFEKDSVECKKLIAMIEAEWEEYKKTLKGTPKPKSLGYKPVLDENGNETNEIEFKFKTNSFFKDGKPNKVKVLKANGQEIDIGDRLIGNESRGCIHGTMAPYTFAGSHGISLYLVGIQLTKFVEYAGSLNAQDLSHLSEGDDEPPFDGFDTSNTSSPDIV